MKKSKLSKIWSSIKKNNPVIFTVVVFLLVVILASANYSNYQNLKRDELTSSVRALEDDLRLLDAVVSELQTTQRIENESKRLDLVKVQSKDIFYLDDSQAKVALR